MTRGMNLLLTLFSKSLSFCFLSSKFQPIVVVVELEHHCLKSFKTSFIIPFRQCKMHKRRVDMLEHVVSSLNHQCYLQLCRQLWYELGETYFEMLHLKLGKMRDRNLDEATPDPQLLNKLNMLTQKSIDNFGHFLHSIYKEG